jgi:hypothetical protein
MEDERDGGVEWRDKRNSYKGALFIAISGWKVRWCVVGLAMKKAGWYVVDKDGAREVFTQLAPRPTTTIKMACQAPESYHQSYLLQVCWAFA